MVESLLQRFAQHDRRALARLLTLLANGEHVPEILAGIDPAAPRARVIAFTGSGGVGKSTVVGKLIENLRPRGTSVAVLACDPQSPLTGGALLGDRFRMPSRPDDAGVFIRSLAAAPGHHALAEHLPAMIRLLEGFGFQLILIETVGAGQGDTAASGVADAVVVLLQPETGDELQWEKAGMLEVADLVVVNKVDMPGADRTVAQVRATFEMTDARNIGILAVSTRTGQGITELADAILALPLRRQSEAVASELLKLALDAMAQRFQQLAVSQDGRLQDLLKSWTAGTRDDAAAIEGLLRLLAEPGKPPRE